MIRPWKHARSHRSMVLWIFVAFVLSMFGFEVVTGLDAIRLLPLHMRPSLVALLTLTIVYGGLRSFTYHPAYNSSYFEWLGSVPWNPSKPLPFGPVLPTWHDAVVLAVLTTVAALYGGMVAPFAVLVGAIGAYSIALLPAFSLLGLHGHAYAFVALVGLGVFLGWTIPVIAAVTLAGFVIALDGARRSIVRLPRGPQWALDFEPTLYGLMSENRSPVRKPPETYGKRGWPYAALRPRSPRPLLSRWRAIFIPLVLGWLLFAIGHALQRANDPLPGGMGALIGAGAAVARILIYAGARFWPISPDARLRLGIPIIPRYDVVFVAPLAAALAGLLLWQLLLALGAPLPLVTAIPFTISLWIVLLAPPTLGRWDLTGAHHLVPTSVSR